MKRWISLAVSLGILALIYWKIDFARVIPVFREASPWWLVLSLGMVVPITMATAWRLQLLAPKGTHLHLGEANRLILLASVLNMVLPSKMGDLAKAGFIARRGHMTGSLALSLVIFEKACDMASLLAWCILGLALYPQRDGLFWTLSAAVCAGLVGLVLMLGSRAFARCGFDLAAKCAPGRLREKVARLRIAWEGMHASFWGNKRQLLIITGASLGIWFLHLAQIWMFTLALREEVPFLSSLALAPLAILAGLLPLTFAGVGTRDAALIFFFSPYMSAPAAAALGILCTMRYFLPALAGLPLLGTSLDAARKDADALLKTRP